MRLNLLFEWKIMMKYMGYSTRGTDRVYYRVGCNKIRECERISSILLDRISTRQALPLLPQITIQDVR